MKCKCCSYPLNMSQHIEKNGMFYKSCPECSRFNSEHVYYTLDAFGNINVPVLGTQSWCISCRRKAEIERKTAVGIMLEPNYSRTYFVEKLKCSQLIN